MKNYKSILTEEEKKTFFNYEKRECVYHGQQEHVVYKDINMGICLECAKNLSREIK